MIRLNDHYFIAWLKTAKNIDYTIENNKLNVKLTSVEYTEYLKEYSEGIKPLLKEIRITVKLLNFLTSQPK